MGLNLARPDVILGPKRLIRLKSSKMKANYHVLSRDGRLPFTVAGQPGAVHADSSQCPRRIVSIVREYFLELEEQVGPIRLNLAMHQVHHRRQVVAAQGA